MLKSTFDAFDVDKKGFISTEMIGTIMDMLGTQLVGEELEVKNRYRKVGKQPGQIIVIKTLVN